MPRNERFVCLELHPYHFYSHHCVPRKVEPTSTLRNLLKLLQSPQQWVFQLLLTSLTKKNSIYNYWRATCYIMSFLYFNTTFGFLAVHKINRGWLFKSLYLCKIQCIVFISIFTHIYYMYEFIMLCFCYLLAFCIGF